MKVSKETSAKHRDELLNAASRLFRERGFDKVGIAEIAAAAGLTHGAFYTHFESKEALCAEVIAHASGRSRAALDSRLNWRASVEAYLSGVATATCYRGDYLATRLMLRSGVSRIWTGAQTLDDCGGRNPSAGTVLRST